MTKQDDNSSIQTGIHPTAIVDPRADIDPGVELGPFVVIGPDVRIGAGTVIKAHTIIEGHTEIGEQNVIGPSAFIGQPPQDTKYKDEPTRLRIGNRNIIREQATLHCGSVGGDLETVVGDGCMLMVGVHIAHNCKIGNEVIIANGTGLGGHVEIENKVVLGGLSGIHQYVRVGTVAMVSALSAVSKDVPPYAMVSGNRAKLFGLNRVGMERVGIPKERRAELRKAYKILFENSLKLKDAVEKISREVTPSQEIDNLLHFIEKSTRGITR